MVYNKKEYHMSNIQAGIQQKVSKQEGDELNDSLEKDTSVEEKKICDFSVVKHLTSIVSTSSEDNIGQRVMKWFASKNIQMGFPQRIQDEVGISKIKEIKKNTCKQNGFSGLLSKRRGKTLSIAI